MEPPKFLIKNNFQKRDSLYEEILTPEILSDVSLKLTGSAEYTCEFDDSGYNKGRLAILEYNGRVFYVSFSEVEIEGRNSSFQSFSTALTKYILEENENKEICFYFLPGITGSFETPYFMFNYRLMKTAGVRFLNSDVYIRRTITPFASPEDIILHKDKIRSANSGNSSTYITRSADDKLQIFGKTYGASKYETANLCLALSEISESKIELYEIEEGGLTKLPKASKEAIESLGVIEIYTSNRTIEKVNFRENNSLRSVEYVYNLLKKLGDKKCAFCDCAIPQIIQGAHVWPVARIKGENHLTADEKLLMAIDGDNGLWLCQNHHKLFDTDILMISGNLSIKHRQDIDTDLLSFIKTTATKKNIDKGIATERFMDYLSKRNSLLTEDLYSEL